MKDYARYASIWVRGEKFGLGTWSDKFKARDAPKGKVGFKAVMGFHSDEGQCAVGVLRGKASHQIEGFHANGR